MSASFSVCLRRCYFADGITEKNKAAPQQAARKCAPIECISMSVPMFAFVYVPTSTGRNRNPNPLNAAQILLVRFSEAFRRRSEINTPSLPQRNMPAKALAKNTNIPAPRATSPSRTTSNGRITNGNMPTHDSHFDFSSFLKKFINMRLFYKIEVRVAIFDEALWVRHRHEGRVELHFCTQRLELMLGKSLNIAPPGCQDAFDSQRDVMNHCRDWAIQWMLITRRRSTKQSRHRPTPAPLPAGLIDHAGHQN